MSLKNKGKIIYWTWLLSNNYNFITHLVVKKPFSADFWRWAGGAKKRSRVVDSGETAAWGLILKLIYAPAEWEN